MFSRGLIISLGVSALASTLLFLYFRNKVTRIEHKVDVMFDLIQNHQQEEAQHYPIHNMEQDNTENLGMAQQMTGAWSENANDDRDLIQVSDNDIEQEESESECDSDEVSDSDEDENIEPPKLISLDQEENVVLSLSDVSTITEKKVIHEPATEDNIQLVSEEQDEVDSLDEDDDDEDDDDFDEDEEEENTIQDTVNNLVKTTVKSHPEEADIKNISVNNDFEQGQVQDQDENDDNSIDYTKLKVSELKALAEAKGLSNYKSLKKGPLVKLLKTHG